jgi:hypothetical protein
VYCSKQYISSPTVIENKNKKASINRCSFRRPDTTCHTPSSAICENKAEYHNAQHSIGSTQRKKEKTHLMRVYRCMFLVSFARPARGYRRLRLGLEREQGDAKEDLRERQPSALGRGFRHSCSLSDVSETQRDGSERGEARVLSPPENTGGPTWYLLANRGAAECGIVNTALYRREMRRLVAGGGITKLN